MNENLELLDELRLADQFSDCSHLLPQLKHPNCLFASLASYPALYLYPS